MNKKIIFIIISLSFFNFILMGCFGDESEIKMIKEKIEKLEKILKEKEVGSWIPLPTDYFQPSIKSILDDFAKLGYNSPVSPANDLITTGIGLLKKSNYNGAYESFMLASELDEKNPEPYFWIGLITPAIGGPPEIARLYLENAIKNDNNSQKIVAMFAYRQNGCFGLMMENYEDANSNFSKCISLNPDMEEDFPIFFQVVYVNRGISYQVLGKTFEALDDYNKALDLALIEPHPPVITKIKEIIENIEKSVENQDDNLFLHANMV